MREVVLVEDGEQLAGGELVAARVGDRLHLLGEVDLEAARQLEVMLGLHQVGDAALARLRVDADDRLVGAAEIHRVDEQVRHVPELGVGALLRVHALLDRVLVRARERGVDELAGVRMARVDRQLVARLDDRLRLVDLREVEPGIDALGEEVQRQRHEVDVAGALAVSEERPLDALGARHQPELGGRDGGAAVVVRVDAEDDLVARGDVALEPLEPVRVDVRREGLDGRRQVDDHPLLARRPPLGDHRLADLERVVVFGAVEALGRVLELDLGRRLPGELPAERGAAHREPRDPVLVEPEHDPPLGLRGRVVEVHDRAPGAVDRLVGALDQLRPRLGEHGDRRVRRDQVLLDEPAHEVEVGLRRRREADLDLLDPEPHEQVEHRAACARRPSA